MRTMQGWRTWSRDSAARAVKAVVCHGLYYSGLLRIWQRRALRGKAVVLMYHRVLDDAERAASASHPALVVSRRTFERQMRWLRGWFSVLSLEEFARQVERGEPFARPSCLVTFDDGWRDNYTNAFPALRREGLPALIFLPFAYIGDTRLFWQEALTHLLLRLARDCGRRQTGVDGIEELFRRAGLETIPGGSEEDRRGEVACAVARMKSVPVAETERLVGDLAAAAGVEMCELARIDGFMSWQQVEEMSRAGIAFGAHGVNHRLLTQVGDEEVEAEIGGSREALAGRFPGTVPTFSYPNGYLTPDVVEKVRGAGYRLAFTTTRGPVGPGGDPLLVRRLNVHESVTASKPMFLARLVGVF